VDGPKGPIYEVKPGIFELARLTHSPVVAVSVAATPVWRFERSWNKAILPKPFARVVMVVEEPESLGDANSKDKALAAHLRQRLFDAKQRANSLLQDRANASFF
jgi:lysophospholipid acyltransferase (LPLAT)-like uncharacterized protein